MYHIHIFRKKDICNSDSRVTLSFKMIRHI